jgi:hypothetical protein
VLSIPQQENFVDCGIYTIAFARALCYGDDPGSPDFQLPPDAVQRLRFDIIVWLAREWVIQAAQVLLQGAVSNTPPLSTPSSVSPVIPNGITEPVPTPFMATIAPFPLAVPSPEETQRVSMAVQECSISLEYLQVNRRDLYCPPLNLWGVWQINAASLYCPAEIIGLDLDTRMATLQCLDVIIPGAGVSVSLSGMTFQHTFADCYDTLDDEGLQDILTLKKVHFIVLRCIDKSCVNL